MAQNDFAIPNQGGQAFRLDVQDALQSLAGHSSGATDPNTAVGTTYPYQFWADTNNSVMKMRNGADSGWIELFQLDGEWSTIAFENGTAAAPSIYFKDSGTDTGFYSPGANQVGISTGGTSALVVDASQRVGIGTTSPSQKLEVDGNIRILNANNLQLANTGDVQFLNAAGTSYSTGIIGSSDNMILYTTDLERARIDSSGRLLVGTSSSPSADQGTVSRIVAQGYVGSNSNGGIISLQRGETAANITSGELLGRISFNDSAGYSFAMIDAYADGTAGASDYPGTLVFSTNPGSPATSPTERLRITSGGILNLNGQRSGFSTPMDGSGNVRVAAASAGGIALSTFDTVDYTAVQFVREVSGTPQQVGSITCTSTATSYIETSDYRLKENVVPLTGAADRLSQLPVHRFNFIADPDNTVDGFLAHEAQAVVPECAIGTKDAVDADGNPVYQGIDKSKLVPLLTAALQEALAEIESLKARVTALEP